MTNTIQLLERSVLKDFYLLYINEMTKVSLAKISKNFPTAL